jgi:peptide/nickel transport system substrate-binding protein
MGQALTKKEVPFYYDGSAAWLADTDYFFRIFYQGDTRWNFGGFENVEMAKLVADARWESDAARYDAMTRRMIEIANAEVPVVMLWQAALELAAQKSIKGFVYYFHRQVDFRKLVRACATGWTAPDGAVHPPRAPRLRRPGGTAARCCGRRW